MRCAHAAPVQADLMLSLRHPNCCAIVGVVVTPPCLVTEYLSRGSLNDVLRAARADAAVAAMLTWPLRLRMVRLRRRCCVCFAACFPLLACAPGCMRGPLGGRPGAWAPCLPPTAQHGLRGRPVPAARAGAGRRHGDGLPARPQATHRPP